MATKKRSASESKGESPIAEDHFAIVDRWRRALEKVGSPRDRKGVDTVSDGGEGNPALSRLEYEWSAVRTGRPGPHWLSERLWTNQVSDSLIGALAVYVDLGVYPPPELLLALAEVFERYMQQGKLGSLEEVFFGPQRQRAGNYAARTASRIRDVELAIKFASIRQSTKTDREATEKLIKERSLNIQPKELEKKVKKYITRRSPRGGK